MAISKITTPLGGVQLLDKINEIITTINNYGTETPCVTSVGVSDHTLTVKYTDGRHDTGSDGKVFTLPDTTYDPASTTVNGLMTTTQYTELNALGPAVNTLRDRIDELEEQIGG